MHFFNDQGGRKNWKQSATTLQLFSWGIRSTCSLKLLSKWFIWLVEMQRRLGIWGVSCRSEGDQLAGELGVPMFHTSVKTDKNVASVFHSLATAHQSRNKDQVEVEQVSWIHFHKTLQLPNKCSTFQFLSEVQGSFLFLYKSLTCGFKGIDLSPNLMMHIVNCLFINFHSQSLLLSITNF